MHILLPETDNCLSWISSWEQITVENNDQSPQKNHARPNNDRAPDLLINSGTRIQLSHRGRPLFLHENICCRYSLGTSNIMWYQIILQTGGLLHILKKKKKKNPRDWSQMWVLQVGFDYLQLYSYRLCTLIIRSCLSRVILIGTVTNLIR